jgi:hypothetical protein
MTEHAHNRGAQVRGPHCDYTIGVSQLEHCVVVIQSHDSTRSQSGSMLSNQSPCARILRHHNTLSAQHLASVISPSVSCYRISIYRLAWYHRINIHLSYRAAPQCVQVIIAMFTATAVLWKDRHSQNGVVPSMTKGRNERTRASEVSLCKFQQCADSHMI